SAAQAPASSNSFEGFHWRHQLRHLLITLGFCVAIAATQHFFEPSPLGFHVKLIYSIATGVPTWAIIDFGRFVLPREPGFFWPKGWRGLALVMTGIAAGYLIGASVGDWWFGWSSWTERRDRILGSVLITAIAGTIASSYFYLRGQSIALKAKAEAAQRQAAESRLKLLQSQLDPHMLFNTLANLRSLIATDPERATAMLDRLNDFLRATLTASRATMHPLATEFERLADYLELMAVRMGPRLSYSLDLPADLAGQPVPTLLLQPLVENSIRHGLEPKVEGGEVVVRARREGAALLIEVKDNGVGSAASWLEDERAGFGLTQVRERLATAFGEHAALAFARDEPGWLCATVRLEGLASHAGHS
ncbi:MAG: histidine kinase, partial [Burkholderiales bacterium]